MGGTKTSNWTTNIVRYNKHLYGGASSWPAATIILWDYCDNTTFLLGLLVTGYWLEDHPVGDYQVWPHTWTWTVFFADQIEIRNLTAIQLFSYLVSNEVHSSPSASASIIIS